jgi:hypothetical protein
MTLWFSFAFSSVIKWVMMRGWILEGKSPAGFQHGMDLIYIYILIEGCQSNLPDHETAYRDN